MTLVGAAVVVGASFLPWARSGSAGRTSYGLVRAAERLDLLDGTAATLAMSWYFVPLAAALAFLAAAAGRPLLAVAVAAIVGAAGLAFSAVVQGGPLPADVGSTIAAIGGTMSLVGASVTVVTSRRQRWNR